MNITDILLLGIAGIGAYVAFTDEGKNMLNDILDLPAIEFVDKSATGYSPEEIQDLIADNAGYHFPIQDLYIPPDYYKKKYEIDTNRIPSGEFWDWYRKGSGLIFEDYYNPPHYTWNPDYYFYFGNMYKKWYPSAMEPNRWAGDRGFEPIAQTARDFPFYPY